MPIRYLLLLTLLYLAHQAHSLSCFPCGGSPCESPRCCDSGQYVPSLCGCCKSCAERVNGRCGGPFGDQGTCGSGMSCYRSCGCRTDRGSKCVFPFTYKGETYYTCTNTDSENGRPWCALEVDGSGEVISGRWDDCNDCAVNENTDGSCQRGDLINSAGICVRKEDREKIEKAAFREADVNPVFRFDEPTTSITSAPFCPPTSPPGAPTCQCASVNADGDKEQPQCQPPFGNEPEPSQPSTYGFCFLENVFDPANPTRLCFADAQWSNANGRFWSNLACKALRDQLQQAVPPPVIIEE